MIAPDMDHAPRVEGIGKAGIMTDGEHECRRGIGRQRGSVQDGKDLILQRILAHIRQKAEKWRTRHFNNERSDGYRRLYQMVWVTVTPYNLENMSTLLKEPTINMGVREGNERAEE